jgi:Cu+-exporting ATPase
MAGTGLAARRGILIRDARALELAHQVRVLAFDKTGTLTLGRPTLTDIAVGSSLEESQAIAAAAQVQAGSTHPLAQAVLAAWQSRGAPQWVAGPAARIETLPGRGVLASWPDGTTLQISSARWATELGVADCFAKQAQDWQAQGRTVSWLIGTAPGGQAQALALMAFGDQAKPGAAAAVARLQALGLKTVMITGDNDGAARAMARQVGIDEVIAGVLPADKAACIHRLREEARKRHPQAAVAMVGDGINDAPALAAADVGMAMGTGTDVAMQTADITLMRGDLSLVADAIAISRQTVRKIHQNLFWAFGYNIIGIPLAAGGVLSPVIAGGAMAMSSVSVLLNALLLTRWSPAPLPQPSSRALDDAVASNTP